MEIEFLGIKWNESLFNYQVVLWGVILIIWLAFLRHMFSVPCRHQNAGRFLGIIYDALLSLVMLFAISGFIQLPFNLAVKILGMSYEAGLGTTIAVCGLFLAIRGLNK